MYLTDNCGEIVFDRLLVGFLKDRGAHVTVAVRDAPILNDATMEDAIRFGFDRVADCLTTTGGGAEIGLDMDKMPAALSRAIDDCTIIIAKGMANYESLQHVPGPAPGCISHVRQVRDDCTGHGDCTRFEDCPVTLLKQPCPLRCPVDLCRYCAEIPVPAGREIEICHALLPVQMSFLLPENRYTGKKETTRFL